MGKKKAKKNKKIQPGERQLVSAKTGVDPDNIFKPKHIVVDDLIVQTNKMAVLGNVPVHYISNFITKRDSGYVMIYPISGGMMPPALGFGTQDFIKFVENLNKIKDEIEGKEVGNG